MAYSVEFSARAGEDLDRVVGYLANALDAPVAARRLLEDLERKLGLVASAPRMHAIDEDLSELVGAEVRSFAVKRYVAWYVLDDTRRVVTVVAFLHDRQDAERWIVASD